MPVQALTNKRGLFSARASQGGSLDRDEILVCLLALAVSVAALLFFFRDGQILLYGDSVAHINIARRLFDTRSPALKQLGTTWLPLPHLLIAPFVILEKPWRTGLGGSIPSMVAYVLATFGIFRLVRRGLDFLGASPGLARLSAWTAAVIFLANPNLIYLQSTAMTEALGLAAFVWTMVFFGQFVANALQYSEFAPQPAPTDSAHAGRSLQRCAWCLLAFMLIRYDGWFFAAGVAFAAVIVFWIGARRRGLSRTHFFRHWKWKPPVIKFLLITAAVPVFWLGYNALEFESPVAFATGPYSAIAIEQRTRRPGDPHYPGWHAPYVAAKYFVKAARLNLGEWNSNGSTFFPLAVVGTILLLLLARPLAHWLLLWLPVLFYGSSMAWGGVPIFLPAWWPFSYYNVRYGVQLLPAVAVFTAFLVYSSLALVRRRGWRVAVPAVVVALVAVCYLQAWAATPISLREGQLNGRSKRILERALAYQLRSLPSSTTLLMYNGEHVGALQIAGIPLRRTINESSLKEWPHALEFPAQSADYVVAISGDPVARAVQKHPGDLRLLLQFATPEQGRVVIYRSTLH